MVLGRFRSLPRPSQFFGDSGVSQDGSPVCQVLQIVGQNAQRNAAQLRLWRWDLQMEPPPGLVKPLEGPRLDSGFWV